MQFHKMQCCSPKFLKHCSTFLMCLLLGTLVACTTSDRTSIDEYSTEAKADFTQLKTYKWNFAAMGKLQPDGSHLPEFDRVLCDHVDKHLAENGFQRMETGSVDFTLDYRVVISQEEAALDDKKTINIEQQSNDYGLRWTFDRSESPSFKGLQAPKDQTVVYQNGTLHIAAFDKQGLVIWHSSASRILKNGRGNEAERRAALRIAVNKVMATFPN
jgi:hypothetical protein